MNGDSDSDLLGKKLMETSLPSKIAPLVLRWTAQVASLRLGFFNKSSISLGRVNLPSVRARRKKRLSKTWE
jgi:hypothetical protein